MLGRLIAPAEQRNTFQNLWGSGALFTRESWTGKQISERNALQLTTVYACVRLLSDVISTLPVDQFIRVDGNRVPARPREAWVQRPDPRFDRPTFYQQVVTSLLLHGNTYVHIMRDGVGAVESLSVLNPYNVEPFVENGEIRYRMRGGGRSLDRYEVLHITEMLLPGEMVGVSRIDQAKETLGLSSALEEYAARFFGNGAYAGGVIEWPDELEKEQATEIIDRWEASHRGLRRSNRPAILSGGAQFKPTTVNPSESQLLDERRFAIEEIARLFRVPPFMLGITTSGAMSFASVEQQMLFFAQHTIQPYVEKIEAAFSSLLRNESSFIKFNLNSLVRADLATRTESYSKALFAGWQSINDVRRLEDLRPVPDGDEYRVPLQNIPLTDTPILSLREKAKVAQILTMAGFDGNSVARLLDLPVDHSGQLSVQVQPIPEDGV